jgi:glutamine synthetase
MSSDLSSSSIGSEFSSEGIQLGVNVVPNLPRDASDRNRTSPFAFTGNKFEFRAVGSSQGCAMPNAVLNTIVADSLRYLRTEIEAEMAGKRSPATDGGAERITMKQAMTRVVKKTLKQHYRIVFNGNGYDEEWVQEAKRRGLANLKTTPEALEVVASQKNIQLLEDFKVMKASEIKAQQHIMLESYSKTINIEAKTTHQIAVIQILPAAIKYQNRLATAIRSTGEVLGAGSVEVQKAHLQKVTTTINTLLQACEKLNEVVSTTAGKVHEGESIEETIAIAKEFCSLVFPQMRTVREHCDTLETIVDDDLWPLPKYSEMMFLR